MCCPVFLCLHGMFPHFYCADLPFRMGGFRKAYFWNGTSSCPICGKPCPSTESNDLAKEQDALVQNLQEVPDTKRLVYMSGRAQAIGKRAASNAYREADFNKRVSADDSLYGNTDYRINKVTGVYMFSFWYAALRYGSEQISSSNTGVSLLPVCSPCRLIVNTSGELSLWSRYCAEEFSKHSKSEALAHDFVHAFGSSVVLAHPNGENLDLQVGCHLALFSSLRSFTCTHYRMLSCLL